MDNCYVACIGSSAGGLDPLKQFFKSLHLRVPAAFIVVTHLPANEPTMLDRIIAHCTDLPVKLLSQNVAIEPFNVYVLPGNLRVRYENGLLVVRDRLETEKINYAIDELLLSLAEGKRDKAIAIILSGMGTDGSAGAEAIHESGGIVLVQAPTSATHQNMPRSAISADHPLRIMKPEDLGRLFSEVVSSREISHERE